MHRSGSFANAPHRLDSRKQGRGTSEARLFAGLGLVLIILLLNAAAASPQLHAWLHAHSVETRCNHDSSSSSPQHQDHSKALDCPVVLMASGVTPMVVDIPVPMPIEMGETQSCAYAESHIVIISLTYGARAPPVLV